MRVFTGLSRIALLLIAGAQVVFADDAHYNEVFDRDGEIRQHYRGIVEPTLAMPNRDKAEFETNSYRAFAQDNRLDVMPNVIPDSEKKNILDRGVKQRAAAIIAFLKDHYSGRRSYREIIPEEVIKNIIIRTGEFAYDGKINPEHIAFFYGPDLIRDVTGRWRVLEDNTGMVGGFGDLRLAREFMLKNRPELAEVLQSPDPDIFYRGLAKSYQARATRRAGKAILLMSSMETDNEDKRLEKIFADFGIETVHASRGDLRLLIEPDGVYTYKKSQGPRSKEKVGFIALNGEHAWFDLSNRASFERFVMENAKEAVTDRGETKTLRKALLEVLAEPYSPQQIDRLAELLKTKGVYKFGIRSQIPGLTAAILKGRVGVNYTPGTEFVSDKEFYIYVEEFIRFYLKEEPILKNIDTWTFADRDGRLKADVFKMAFENLDKFVIKKFDGRGGDAVWVGPKMDKNFIPMLKKMVEEQPGSFKVQAYTPPSTVLGKIVDKRLIAEVYSTARTLAVRVANTLFGRGVSKEGDGKVNLGARGTESAVFIRTGSAGTCHDIFLKSRVVSR